MTVNSSLASGDTATLPSARLIPLLVGTCEIDPAATVTLDPGDDVVSILGGGVLTEAALFIHASTGKRVEVRRASPTWGTLPSVTQTGSGPAITVALSSGSPGALYPYNIRARVAVPGANGVAQLAIAYDGVLEIETVTIPEEPPAILRGKVDIASGATLSTKHLDFTAPSSAVITFATNPTTGQGVADAFNALAIAAPFAVRARVYQATTGEQYLELYSTSGGSSVSITIDATASDVDDELGFTAASPSNLTATGSTAKITLPHTGVDLVCAAGTYVLAEAYTTNLPRPTATVQAVTDAVTAALEVESFLAHPFGRIFVVDAPSSHTIARGMSDALTSLCAAAIADPDKPAFVDFAAPTALHTASATKSTNDAAIASNDTAMLAAFAGQSLSYVRNRVHGGCYVAGSSDLRPGTHRHSAAFAAAAKHSGLAKIAANPAEGTIPGITLLGPDQLTRERDETAATTKLGKLKASPQGSWVLKSTARGETKFEVCATGAGPTSRLRSPGAGTNVGLEILRLVFAHVEGWEGETPETDPSSPKAISPEEAETRANDLHAALAEVLTPSDPSTPSNVSGDFTVKVAAPLLLDDETANVTVVFNPLAEIGAVVVKALATGAKLANA